MDRPPASPHDPPPGGTGAEGPQSPSSLAALVLGAWRDPRGRVALAGWSACLCLLAAAFWPTLRQFAYVWATDDNYSHGFLVPLISLYFANEAARLGPVAVRSGVLAGVALLGLALAGRLATIVVPVGIVADGSFLLGLAGVVALMAGADALRQHGFALGFLVFMIPLPVALYATIASPLQLLVSRVAEVVLNASDIPVLREGNLLTLPGDVRMFVAEACSGMRQLTGFLALTTAVAYLARRPAWHRGVLVASAIPVAMTANAIRVTMTGYLMSYDPRFGVGTFHTVEGLLMMGFGLAMLGAECWALNRLADLVVEAEPPPPSPPPTGGAR